MGIKSQDQRLVMEGRKRHVVAANALRRELGDSSTPIKITASAILAMMMAKVYSATSSGLAGCATHIVGVTANLDAHFSQPDARPVHGGVLKMYSRVLLFKGVIHRKALFPHQRLRTSESEYDPGSIDSLIHIGFSLPGLLKTADTQISIQQHQREDLGTSAALVPVALDLGVKLDTWL
jgi:hypothetical protein